MKTKTSHRVQVETTTRFPSGQWTGFWLQPGLTGRQQMRLSLRFADGVVRGEGDDLVGKFSIWGRYNGQNGRVRLRKQYAGQHHVDYAGMNEGDGQWLWGLWHLGSDRGGFHIWPEEAVCPVAV